MSKNEKTFRELKKTWKWHWETINIVLLGFLEEVLAGLTSGFVFCALLSKPLLTLFDSLIEWFYLQLFGCQKLPLLETQSQVSLIAFLERVFVRPFMVLRNTCNFFLFRLPKLQLRFHLRGTFFRPFLKIMLTKFSEVEKFFTASSRQLSFSNVYYSAFLEFGHF